MLITHQLAALIDLFGHLGEQKSYMKERYGLKFDDQKRTWTLIQMSHDFTRTQATFP